MGVKYTNNARTTLNGSVTNVATSIVVTDGSVFPAAGGADYFYMTLENAAGTTREIVKVTARSTNTLTVVRGQDGTSATAFANADKAELRMVSAILTDLSSSSYIVSALAGQAVSTASYNKVAITAPATGSTLTIVDGKTFTASNTLTLAGTDSSTLNIGAGGTLGALAVLATGAEGKTIQVVSGTPAWVDPSGGAWELKTTTYTFVAGDKIYAVLSGPTTFTLPATPSAGDSVEVIVVSTYTLTIARNGQTIEGLSEDMDIDGRWHVTMCFSGTTWQIVAAGAVGLGTTENIKAFLTTPSSANLLAAVSDETGTGALVFANGPTITLANATGLLPTGGGTGISSYTTGDLIYASGTNTLAKRAVGSEGQVFSVVSGVPTWAAPASSGISVAARQTAHFNAAASTLYPVDTTSGAITATLPASPAQGDRIGFYDAAGTWDTNNLTIGRNGNNIVGAALNLIADVEWVGFTLAWDATRGWAIAQ